jgi:DNA-directed RNA polymerase specialized sigma24 family protein
MVSHKVSAVPAIAKSVDTYIEEEALDDVAYRETLGSISDPLVRGVVRLSTENNWTSRDIANFFMLSASEVNRLFSEAARQVRVAYGIT